MKMDCPLSLSVLVFHLLLTCSCRGESQLIGPPQPIEAGVGDDVILPCHLRPAMDVTKETLEWTRPDLDPRFVYVQRSGNHLVNVKNPSYRGRTSLFINELKNGNISLKLSKVQLSDQGTYDCGIPLMNKLSFVKLVVVSGTASSPVISLTETDRNRGSVALQCESEGWYPEPEVSWLDGEGHVLSAGPTETVRGPDGLYTVSSRVTVEKRHNNNFTCRVQQKNINQIRETQIRISDYFFEAQSSSAPIIITTLAVLLAFCSVFIFAIFFFVCKWKQKLIKIKRSHGDETDKMNKTDEDRETKSLRTDETVEMKVLEKGEKQKKIKHSYKWFKDEHQRTEEAEREVESLKKQVKNLTEEKQRDHQQLQTQLENKTQEVDKLEAEVKKIREEKTSVENERQKLQTELKTTRTKVKKLTKEKQRIETERQNLQTQLDAKIKEVENNT